MILRADTEIGFFNKFGDFSYVKRMEIELAKMAARGLTVVAGSGDAGASNVGEAGVRHYRQVLCLLHRLSLARFDTE